MIETKQEKFVYLSSEIEPIFYSKTDPLLRKIYDLIGRFWWDIDPLPHLFHGSLEHEPPLICY